MTQEQEAPSRTPRHMEIVMLHLKEWTWLDNGDLLLSINGQEEIWHQEEDSTWRRVD